MKFIFFALTLSLITQCWSFDRFAPDEFADLDSPHFQLSLQKHRMESQILKALVACNETFNVPFEESIELFKNAPFGIMRMTNEPAKCLMDCIMRTMDVMTDKGFDGHKYLKQVKQLRYNYTSYDVNKLETPKRKVEVLAAIKELGQTEHNYEIIQAYEYAVEECGGKRDPKNERCETSFRVARCIANRCRELGINNPFYPVFRVSRYRP